jgi:hypothetical protein
MSLFHLFSTFGVIAVFGLVSLSAAAVGFLTPDPTGGVIWVAISAYMGLVTILTTVTLYNRRATVRY